MFKAKAPKVSPFTPIQWFYWLLLDNFHQNARHAIISSIKQKVTVDFSWSTSSATYCSLLLTNLKELLVFIAFTSSHAFLWPL